MPTPKPLFVSQKFHYDREEILDVHLLKEILKGQPKGKIKEILEIYKKFKEEMAKKINDGYILKFKNFGRIFLNHEEPIKVWSFKEKKCVRILKVKSYWQAHTKIFNFYTYKGAKLNLEQAEVRLRNSALHAKLLYEKRFKKRMEQLNELNPSAIKAVQYMKLPEEKKPERKRPMEESFEERRKVRSYTVSMARRNVRMAITRAIGKYKKSMKFIEYLEKINYKINIQTIKKIQDIINIMSEEQIRQLDNISIRASYVAQFIKRRHMRPNMFKIISNSEVINNFPEFILKNPLFEIAKNDTP